MSSNIFLVRSTPADFDAMVRSAVETDEHPGLTHKIAGIESIRFFNHPESILYTFNEMTARDLVAFHQGGEYVGIDSIGTIIEADN